MCLYHCNRPSIRSCSFVLLIFKSKYDKHLKTREHLFNIDCEEPSSSACDYSLCNILDPPVDEADHATGAVNTQCTSSVLWSHSDYESIIAGPSTLCVHY